MLYFLENFENWRFCAKFSQNKTSILWTPGSQVYLSKKKKLFGHQKQIRKMHKIFISFVN